MGVEELTRERGGRALYLQVADQILRDIHAGRLSPGDRVASEPELMRAYNVSRSTAGKALARLEETGVVRREQGRGTFVLFPRLLQRRPQLGSFSESVRRLGHVPTQRLVSLDRVAPGAAGELGAFIGSDVPLVRLVRLRLVDGEPVGLHTTLLPEAIAATARVDSEHLAEASASLYALLDASGVHIVEADEHLQAVGASEEEASLLGVPAGTALMRVVRASYDPQHTPVEVVDARYVGDRFDYSVSLVRAGAPAASTITRKETPDEDQAPHDSGPAARRHGDGGRVRQTGR